MDKEHADRFKNLYTAVGQMTIRWAAVETNIDILVWVVMQKLQTGEAETPRALNRKTRLLRKWFTNLPELRPFREQGVSVADQADSLADTRNWIVHGVVANVLEYAQTGDIQFNRTRYGKQTNTMEQKRVRIRDIDDCSVKLLIFMNETLRFGYEIQRALDSPSR
ncbi:hypothetical protein [Arvimicrobium flavum]|uniref:hypothetical protein n=1 Tax=Arvimicrobium flavum TaxID=3393320 RepID=UPI00237AFE84|nr:hypothetical protein [Mesorhizobium shangrilense]